MYQIDIEKELSLDGEDFYVFISAEIGFKNEDDPICDTVEIVKADISRLDGSPLAIDYDGRRLEKVIVTGFPALTKAIDEQLWEAIDQYTEDNFRFISNDLVDSRYEKDL